MTYAQFHGAWPALLTPAADDGGVNEAVLRDLTDALIEKGIGGLYLCGSTGEGVFMSVVERKQVTEVVMDQNRGRVPVIVHVGCVATRHAVELTHHARNAGVDGVASILPPFRRGQAETILHYERIAAAALDLPFFPYLFGGETDALSLMRELLRRIPNIGGAKYTGPDMYELGALVDLKDEGWTIFSGMDQECVFAAMSGSPANIGSTLNLMPGVYRALRSAYEEGDLQKANDLQRRANRITRTLQAFGFFGALFEAVRLLGFDCGHPRLPHAPFPPDQRDAFRQALDAVGFFEIAAM
jgi:N-acetylneuraminate lyase